MSRLKGMYISQSLEQSLTPPETPPNEKAEKLVHPWPEPETMPKEMFPPKRRKPHHAEEIQDTEFEISNALNQGILLRPEAAICVCEGTSHTKHSKR
jgi:hypothetical protein